MQGRAGHTSSCTPCMEIWMWWHKTYGLSFHSVEKIRNKADSPKLGEKKHHEKPERGWSELYLGSQDRFAAVPPRQGTKAPLLLGQGLSWIKQGLQDLCLLCFPLRRWEAKGPIKPAPMRCWVFSGTWEKLVSRAAWSSRNIMWATYVLAILKYIERNKWNEF